MSRPVPEHGTEARRWGTKLRPPCTCPTCLTGSRRARKLYLVRHSRGVPGMAPTGPVSAHLKMVLASGRTVTHIAKEADVSPETVRSTIAVRRPTMLKAKADKLMAVRPVPEANALIDSTGTMRRLRALVAMGHPQDVIAAEVGCAYTYVSMMTRGHRPTATVALAQAVQGAYAKLSMTVGPSVRSQNKASRYGWHGPLAWDDDTIDDPRAVPLTDAPMPVATEGENVAARWLYGESVVLDRDSRRQVLQHLYEWTNDTTSEIAAQLEMTPVAAERQWERLKERAAAEGRRLWRRVYVPRERDLTQNEMEEAA